MLAISVRRIGNKISLMLVCMFKMEIVDAIKVQTNLVTMVAITPKQIRWIVSPTPLDFVFTPIKKLERIETAIIKESAGRKFSSLSKNKFKKACQTLSNPPENSPDKI